MASDYRLEYISPRGESVTLDPRAYRGPYFLTSTTGLLPSATTAQMTGAIGQRGETVAGLKTSSKVVAAQVAILTTSEAELWATRSALARALVIEPPDIGEDPETGTLRLYRPGRPVVEADAIPEDSPREGGRVGRHDYTVDIEFRLVSPYWRAEGTSELVFATEGALQFPLEHPMEITSSSIEAHPTNLGDVSAPMTIRIDGEVVNPRLESVERDKVVRLIMTIPPDDYVEIDTSFGRKSITWYKADGTTENAMRYLDLAVSELWWLLPGENTVIFDADNNISGSALITWISQWSGV